MGCELNMDNDLTILVNEILELLKEQGLSKNSIKNYYYEGFRPIIDKCSANGISHYQEDAINLALSSIAEDAQSGKIYKFKKQRSQKAAALLKEYVGTHAITLKRLAPNPKVTLHDHYEGIILEFRNYLETNKKISSKSSKSRVSIIRLFLKYLEDNNISNLQLINLNTVNRFLTASAKQHPCSMDIVRLSLRNFSDFSTQKYACIDFSAALVSRPAPRRKLMPVFTDDEIDALLEEAKKSVSSPLRDYAIIKLASNLGIREIDVVNLKLTDIDWHRCSIKFIQHKTGVECELPLSADVGNAIANYILNERPKTYVPFVFIRARAPYIKLDSHAPGDRVRTFMRKSPRINYNSGDRKGFHSFRRYVASQMVDNNVPSDTVKDILGHQHIDSMKPYIRISKNKLSLCAIGLVGIEVTQEEYI